MPASPTPAQSSASRDNGALTRGPSTPEGRARSAQNGTRHNLHGSFRLLAGEEAAAFDALRRDLHARNAPQGEAEAHWCDELARAAWRQRRLFALEDAAMTAPLAGPKAAEGLPSLATIARYRARIERDTRLAREQLDALRAARPRLPISVSPAQLGWLRTRAEEAGEQATDDCTPESDPAEASGVPNTQGTPEPEAPPSGHADRPLNRHERRRLAALARRRAPA